MNLVPFHYYLHRGSELSIISTSFWNFNYIFTKQIHSKDLLSYTGGYQPSYAFNKPKLQVRQESNIVLCEPAIYLILWVVVISLQYLLIYNDEITVSIGCTEQNKCKCLVSRTCMDTLRRKIKTLE